MKQPIEQMNLLQSRVDKDSTASSEEHEMVISIDIEGKEARVCHPKAEHGCPEMVTNNKITEINESTNTDVEPVFENSVTQVLKFIKIHEFLV
jgi:hypothetical protein